MIRIISIITLFCTLTISALRADEVQMTASAPQQVATGDQFRLIYTVNADAGNFSGPKITDATILMGPSSSNSSSIQIINGNMTRSVTSTYTYIIRADKEGILNIPPASCEVKNKTYRSNSLTVKVVKQSTAPASHNNATQQPRKIIAELNKNDVFIKAIPNRTKVIQGEQVLITYKLYTRVPIAQYGINKYPAFAGFWSKDLLKEKQKLRQYKEQIDNDQYTVAEIHKVALVPQKQGELIIDPLEVDVVAQLKKAQRKRRTGDPLFDNFFDDSFFGSSYENIQRTLTSNTTRITVTPLPQKNQPDNFTGAVGEFSFNGTIDRDILKAGEAFNLKFTIQGTGNIELVNKPLIQFPPDFDVYDPKVKSNISSSMAGVSGSKTFEYLIIPRRAGAYTIPAVAFSYYSLKSKQYITLQSSQFDIEVIKGDNEINGSAWSTPSREDVQYINKDIRFIKTGTMKLHSTGNYFYASQWFYFSIIIPPLIFAFLLLILGKQKKNQADVSGNKLRKANKMARKRLQTAEKHMKQNNFESFYEELSQALWGYLSDKLTISRAALSMENAHKALIDKGLEKQLIERYTKLLDRCEFARFAPGDKSQAMRTDYQEAIDSISIFERKLK